jgi:HlyD family secretion protein
MSHSSHIQKTIGRYTLLLLAGALLLSGCGKSSTDVSGYIDTDMTYLSSSYAERVQKLMAERGSTVQSGQAVFQVDPTFESLSAEYDQSSTMALRAERDGLEDQIKYAAALLKRQQIMRKSDASSVDDLEIARKNLEVLHKQKASVDARIAAAQALTKRTEWQKSEKEGIAPAEGLVFDTFAMPGEFTQAGQPILALITPDSLKVIFFVAERELGDYKVGQKLKISTDGNSESYVASISYISNQAEYTPPMIFSRDERKKLVFKIIARPDSPTLQKMHLGQPVTVSQIHE